MLTVMSPRVAVVGGGPGGLFLATLIRRSTPGSEVTLFERNQATDAFGFGVVFSDATLRTIDEADPVLRDALASHGRHWERIEVWSNGERHGFSGNGMAAIHRRVLLKFLQENSEAAGVELRFGHPAPPVDELRRSYDLVVGADGTNSVVRDHLADVGHTVETAKAKFIWFGTTHLFDGLTFVHRVSEHGNFAVHGYPISDELSTFIVETDERAWLRAGMDAFDISQAPGPSDVDTQRYLEKLFAEDIGGASLVANNSRWGNFRTRRTQRWYADNVVMLGDAVHTAHFSVGSGTKMAMEDAVTLAEHVRHAWSGDCDLGTALERYQEERARSVAKIQDAARPSLAWWERFGRYQQDLDPRTFAFHFFSRSIGVAKIAQRDPDLVAEVRTAWEQEHGAPAIRSTLALPHPGADNETVAIEIERLLHVESATPDARGVADGRGNRLRLLPRHRAPSERAEGGAQVVELVEAPSSAAGLPAAVDALPDTGVVAIAGDDELTKILLCEEARLSRGLTTILLGPYDDDAAETLILSGRADAVVLASSAGGITDD
jgi:2-polyprenyl-6-methoxyphenol hydroxylase-like FAD-dependent oxidoreductase